MADLIGQKLDRYTITSLLGEGGVASVYRAHQETVDRDVAVKVIESKLPRNPDFLKRFEREARTFAAKATCFTWSPSCSLAGVWLTISVRPRCHLTTPVACWSQSPQR